MRIDLSPERSTALKFFAHEGGITTLGFSNAEYDYEDPEGVHFENLKAAERPTSYFKTGAMGPHVGKRPVEKKGEKDAKEE